MSDDAGYKLIIVGIVMWAIVMFTLIVMIDYSSMKYPIGASVSTTTEYNDTFNDSFSGHIIAKSWGGITIRNENGNERVLYRRWIKVGDA